VIKSIIINGVKYFFLFIFTI